MLENGGVQSLLFTSDNPIQNKDYGTTDGGKNVKQYFPGMKNIVPFKNNKHMENYCPMDVRGKRSGR